MPTQQIIDQVEALVKDLVAARKAFTAFNVTRELRAKGDTVVHRELRPIVHGIYRKDQMGDYQHCNVQPSGFPTPAILYHPPEVDPNDFVGEILVGTAQATTPDADDDDDDDDGNDDDDDKVVRKLTSDGILYIPRWMGRKINAKPGSIRVETICYGGGDTEIIVDVGTPQPSPYHPHVDTRKNIRLGKAFLSFLGADWPAYEIEFDGTDKIVIRKA